MLDPLLKSILPNLRWSMCLPAAFATPSVNNNFLTNEAQTTRFLLETKGGWVNFYHLKVFLPRVELIAQRMNNARGIIGRRTSKKFRVAMTFLRVQAFLERIDPALQIRKFRTPAFNKSSKTLESFPLFPFLSTERKGEGKFHDECGIRVIVEGGTKRFNVIFSGKYERFRSRGNNE